MEPLPRLRRRGMLAVVDWGTGKVTDVGDAAAGDRAYCDGCDNSITTGPGVRRGADALRHVQASGGGAVRGCFEDITSDMDVARAPGGEFLVLVEPWFL